MPGKLRLWRWIAAVAVLAVALPVLHFHLRDRRLGKRLVDGVIERSKDRPRPVVGQPVGTTFEACLAPLLLAIPDAGAFASTSTGPRHDLVLSINRGDTDYLDGGVELEGELAALLPWAEDVLSCTRAPATGEAPGLGPFAIDGPLDMLVVRAEQLCSRIVVYDIRRATAAGDAGSALGHCVQQLALARDGVSDKGLVGAMVAAATTHGLVFACRDAALVAEPEPLRRFDADLQKVHASLATFSEVMGTETLQTQLICWGRHVPLEQVARLPENARKASSQGSRCTNHSLSDALLYFVWADYVERMETIRSVSGGPARSLELDRLSSQETLIERYLSDSGGSSSFSRFADRYDGVGQSMDLLASVARVRLGEAPLPGLAVAPIDGGIALSVDVFSQDAPSRWETIRAEVLPAALPSGR